MKLYRENKAILHIYNPSYGLIPNESVSLRSCTLYTVCTQIRQPNRTLKHTFICHSLNISTLSCALNKKRCITAGMCAIQSHVKL